MGIASILITSVMLAIPTALMLRRWDPPFGSFTVLFGVATTLLVGLDEFRQFPLILAGLIGGIAADLTARRLPVATAPIGVAALWTTYFAVYQITQGGVAWTAELWTGAVFLSALFAGAIGLIGQADLALEATDRPAR